MLFASLALDSHPSLAREQQASLAGEQQAPLAQHAEPRSPASRVHRAFNQSKFAPATRFCALIRAPLAHRSATWAFSPSASSPR